MYIKPDMLYFITISFTLHIQILSDNMYRHVQSGHSQVFSVFLQHVEENFTILNCKLWERFKFKIYLNLVDTWGVRSQTSYITLPCSGSRFDKLCCVILIIKPTRCTNNSNLFLE